MTDANGRPRVIGSDMTTVINLDGYDTPEPLDLPKAFNGYEREATERHVAQLTRHAAVAVRNWQEQTRIADELRTRVGALEEQLRTVSAERDDLRNAASKPYEAAGAQAQALVDAATKGADMIRAKAHEEADRLTVQARSQADTIVDQAQGKADRILKEADGHMDAAKRDADRLLKEAADKGHAMIDAAEAHVTEVGQALEARERESKARQEYAMQAVDAARATLERALAGLKQRES